LRRTAGVNVGLILWYGAVITDCKLSPEAQIEIDAKKRKSQAKKITGFQVVCSLNPD
jgi:arginine exporter protein ArgO